MIWVDRWKRIPGFAYEVSDGGAVRRIETKRLLKLHVDKDGYEIARIYRRGVRTDRKVHQLVCAAFNRPRRNRKEEVRHLDSLRRNNVPTNLTWGTPKQNAEDRERHGHTARGEMNSRSLFSDSEVRRMRREYRLTKLRAVSRGAKYVPRGYIQDLAASQGMDRQTLHRILAGGSANDLG